MVGLDPDIIPPWRWMVPLCFVFVNECVCLTMLYPFVGFMVVDFGLVEDTNQAGMYAGYIASAFVLGQMCTCSMWGTLSDRIGRVRVICVGLFATMILAPLFGLSANLWQAMAVRFVMGLLNGNQGVAKVLCSAVRCGAVQCSAVRRGAAAVRCGAMCGAVRAGQPCAVGAAALVQLCWRAA